MFKGCSSLIKLNLTNFATNKLGNMKGLFSECSSLFSIDISSFDLSRVTNMNSIFSDCRKLISLNLDNLKINNVVDMNSMFKGCSSLTSITFSNFDTSKVINMEKLFSDCNSLTTLDISNFKVSSVKIMAYMFSGCKLLNSLKLPDFSSLSVQNTSHMFSDCSTLNSLDLSNFDSSSVTTMDYMFSGCRFLVLLNINNLNTANVYDMKFMFADCSSLKKINLDSFDTRKVKYMNGMFYGCESLESLKISHFDTTLTENMSFMFYHLKLVEFLFLSNFNTSNVEYMYYMFEGCESLARLNISNFDVSKIKIFDGMFSGCSKLLSLSIPNFYTKNAISMSYLFNKCSSLNYLDISNFDTSLTTSIKYMFSGCNSLTSLDVSHFKTSLVTSMEYLFSDCSSLKKINASNFDTKSVTNMGHMFNGCSGLTSINIDNFETSNVKYMEYMFSGCSSLANISVTKLNTSSVINMGYMFNKCELLTTLDLSNFDTHLTEISEYMFKNAINMIYINFQNYDESNMKIMDNMFLGTLENMVFCFNVSLSPKLNRLVQRKGCSIVNCSNDWVKSRKKIVEKTNECVDNCPPEYSFVFDSKCYFRCPDGSYPDDGECRTSYSSDKNDTCSIKKYFLNVCKINLQTPREKRKFIENTTNGITNNELSDLVLLAIEQKYNFTIKEENEIYQIYPLSSRFRDPNLTYINLDECGKLLREFNGLSDEDDIIVFKIEYKSPDFKIPIIEYNLFGYNGKRKLSLHTCNDLKIKYYIPKIINDYEDYKYNPANNYYYDRCLSSVLTIQDRKDFFNQNNMSLCESLCTYKGYENNHIICECKVKTKFNSFLNVNVSKYDLIYRFESSKLNTFNFWIFKCYSQFYRKEILINNLCSEIILGIIIVTFIGALFFCIKEHDMVNKKIFILIELINMKAKYMNDKNNSSKNNLKTSKNEGIENSKNNLKLNNKKSNNNKKDDKHIENNNQININIINFRDKNKIKKDRRELKEYEEKTDNELNYAPYYDAILYDKRNLLQIYFSLIKTKQIILLPFVCKNDFNPRTMKLCFILYILTIFLVTNTIFVNDSTLHKLYMFNGKTEIFYDIPKIVYTVLISSTIKNFLLLVCFPENDIINIRRFGSKIMFQQNQGIQKSLTSVIIRCYLYFLISEITLILFWTYVACFFLIFPNSKTFVLKNTLISIGISSVAPFILYIIPSFIRSLSLKSEATQSSYCFYVIAIILQAIL